MAAGVDVAVESWMAQVEQVFTDASGVDHLGKLNALRETSTGTKSLTGKSQIAMPKSMLILQTYGAQVMIVELLYSGIINATWFLLTGWGLFLVVACVVEFRQELFVIVSFSTCLAVWARSKVKRVLVELHLLEAHAAQKFAPTASLPPRNTAAVTCCGRAVCSSCSTASGFCCP